MSIQTGAAKAYLRHTDEAAALAARLLADDVRLPITLPRGMAVNENALRFTTLSRDGDQLARQDWTLPICQQCPSPPPSTPGSPRPTSPTSASSEPKA